MAITLSCTLMHIFTYFTPEKCDPANPAPGNRNHPGNRKHPGNHNKMVPGNPDPRNVVIVVI